MILRYHTTHRGGIIVVMTAITLVAVFTFVAVAIDLATIMIARNQCQAAADAAALAGARTLNGDVSNNNNYANVQPNATAAATANQIMGQAVITGQLTVTIGDYYYDTASASFKINPSGRQTGDNWTLAQATVTYQGQAFFSKVMGMSAFNSTATATAAHRPRDVVTICDFSGSMRFDSLIGTPHNSTRNASMNPETVYPQFGHYTGNSNLLTFQGNVQASTGEIQGAANITVTTNDGSPVYDDFYADAAAFGTSTLAFTAAPTSYATTPGGDNYLFTSKNSTTTYAQTVKDITGSSSRDPNWELDGYAAYPTSNLAGKTDYSTVPFKGYTQGPNYWGKTFFVWPPDPRQEPGFYRQIANVKQFLTDILGSSGTSGSAIEGIYLANGVTGSKNWPPPALPASNWWPDAATLGTYLKNKVGLTVNTDQKYEKILRLFSLAASGATPPSNPDKYPSVPGIIADGQGNADPNDWRARFFWLPDGVTKLNVNSGTNLGPWNSGTWVRPNYGGGPIRYLVNYDSILDWILNTGPNPFPSQLRAGGVRYYTAIPTHIDTSTFPPTDPNQRFWKEYIDEVLGLQQASGTGTNPNYNAAITGNTGYGPDFSWGTVQTSALPAGTPPATYMSYTDNPQRPLLHFWFGPMSMIDFLGNYNMNRFWWPGNATEAPTYQTKLGMQAALKDILINHPNDNVAQIFFSSPKPDAGSTGYYNYARVPLGRDYYRMINSLWFSPKVINTNAEISVYDASGNLTADIADVPRANGGTCYAMPLMLAYNQLSTNPILVNYTANATAGTAGGNGRNGAAKLVIFETDGMVNTGCQANLISAGPAQGYYQVRVGDANNWSASGTEFPTSVGGVSFSTGASQSTTIAQQICNNVSSGGFSTTRKPVLIHCIAFGSLFDASNASSYKTNALQNLANLEVIGSVQTGSPTTLAPNKIITGNYSTRISLMQAAFRSIMEDGAQVTLLSTGPGLP